MNHPAIKRETPAMQTGSAIPWSAEHERRLRRRITNLWLGMWACFLTGLVLFSLAYQIHVPVLIGIAGLCFGGGLLLFVKMCAQREMLGEEMRRGPGGEFFEGSGMLANKPRNTQRLTTWVHHPSSQIDFVCTWEPGCGRHHRWMDAKWIPNYDTEQFGEAEYSSTVDPGGGRFVILCPCGIGHFKLKGN